MRILVLATLFFLAACSTSTDVARILEQPENLFSRPVSLSAIPFFPQDEYQCGPAALATVLSASDIDIEPEHLVDAVYIPERKGSLQVEMLAAARSHGRIAYKIAPNLDALLREVQAGKPVLVLQNLSLRWMPRWHYAVVTGYDLQAKKLVLNSGTIENYRVDLNVFSKTWARSDNWAFITLRPGELPAVAEESAYFEAVADFESMANSTNVTLAYQSGLQRWPNSRLMSAALGNRYYTQGDLAAALNQYQSLLSQHPDYADGHNNLAHLLTESGSLSEALHHAQRAIELGGERAALYRQTLASIKARSVAQP